MDRMLRAGLMKAARRTRAGLQKEATAWLRRVISDAGAGAPWGDAGAGAPRGDAGAGAPRGDAGAGAPRPKPASAKPPPGGRFLSGHYAGDAGTLQYKLYVPGGQWRGARPLVVMLHGCTQSPDDFAAGTRMNELADTEGCLVLYPAQSGAANAQRCWNWFRPEDQRRDAGEPALIAGATRAVMQDHPVDPRQVYVAGLSAGGAAAVIMGAAYPDLYAAVGVHSGLACGAAHDMMSAFTAMRGGGWMSAASAGGTGAGSGPRIMPTIVFHADADTTVHPRNGDQIIAQAGGAVGLRTEEQSGRAQGGHAYRRTVYRDAKGAIVLEQWLILGAGHAWSGGSAEGSFTDPRGPDASREMLRFFRECPWQAGEPR